MSDMSLFLKKNKKKKENTFYPATESLCDANGEPVEWEFRPLTSKENDEIQAECAKEIPIKGKPSQYRQRVDNVKYIRKALATSVVYPNLLNAEVQDSYGVTSPEDLIVELIDDAGEWSKLILFFNQFNGFSNPQEEVDEAKNS